MNFEKIYQQVRGIVGKTQKTYYLKGWEKEDWEQEGMLVLYELLEKHPELASHANLRVYYKVKFTNYIKDLVRKQESQKRKFDRMAYEEVSELGYQISSPGLLLDEIVVLRDSLARYKSSLSPEDQKLYEKVVRGEVFKGRKAILRRMKVALRDFQE